MQKYKLWDIWVKFNYFCGCVTTLKNIIYRLKRSSTFFRFSLKMKNKNSTTSKNKKMYIGYECEILLFFPVVVYCCSHDISC